MKKFQKLFKKLPGNKIFQILIFLSVLYFTFVVRAHNYDKVPGMGHLEEMLFAWSGIYLVETGVPVSWSTLDYPKSAEVYKGKMTLLGHEPSASVTLYKPWLDEPPLFSLIVGWTAHQFHADRNFIIPSSYIRLPSIFFAAITSIFIFLIARFVSGYWTGILSMLVYGVTPIIVFSSRFAIPENLIAMFFAITVYLMLKFEANPRFLYLLPIPLFAGFAGLSKPTGYFIAPFAIYFAFLKKYYKGCLYIILGTIPFILLFIWYGNYFDPKIFSRIVEIQGSRPNGFSSLAFIFSTPAYDIFTIFDGWYVFCLISAVYFLFAPGSGNKRFISLGFIYWILIVMFSGGEQDLLPWYRIPAYPLLSILGAWGIKLLFDKISFFKVVLGTGLLLGNRYYLVNAFRPNVRSMEFRYIFSSLIGPALAYSIFDKSWLEKLSKWILVGVIVVGAYINVVYIYNKFELDCENQSCPFGPTTFFSELHFPIIWRLFVLGPSTYK